MRRLLLTNQQSLSEPVQAHHNAMPPDSLSKVEQMACFIADHYTNLLHVEDIAATVHLHPNYAMSLFRKHIGMSIIEYINQYRIAHAQRLLITTDANVSEIAIAAGFGSVSRFYSVFKAVCQQLPADYRNHLNVFASTRAQEES